jgi:phospholipid/cholesterol/gamma-HCH transport system permease protein
MSTARPHRKPIHVVNPFRVCESIGRRFLRRSADLTYVFAVLWATIALAARPASWTQPVRSVFVRQVLFTSVDAVFVAMRFGATVGVLIIVQAATWIDYLGITTDSIAPLLWRTIVRELAPLLACMVVIGRSGIAIATELATMRVNRELEVLESQGIDTMTYLVMPRILSVIVSVFSLAIIIATSMVVTGYAIGWAVDAIRISWTDFLHEIIRQFSAEDLLFFVPKTIISGGFAGTICCIEGLKVRGTFTDVPRVTNRAGTRALTAVFAVSAVLSVVIYGRILVFPIF